MLQCSDESDDQTVYTIADQFPRFPGCEEGLNEELRQDCATKAMLEFQYTNLTYPTRAREDSIQGRVIISFIVEKQGDLTDFEVTEDIGGGCGEEALRVAQLLPQPWNPGFIEGKRVRVRYNLPFRFRL